MKIKGKKSILRASVAVVFVVLWYNNELYYIIIIVRSSNCSAFSGIETGRGLAIRVGHNIIIPNKPNNIIIIVINVYDINLFGTRVGKRDVLNIIIIINYVHIILLYIGVEVARYDSISVFATEFYYILLDAADKISRYFARRFIFSSRRAGHVMSDGVGRRRPLDGYAGVDGPEGYAYSRRRRGRRKHRCTSPRCG